MENINPLKIEAVEEQLNANGIGYHKTSLQGHLNVHTAKPVWFVPKATGVQLLVKTGKKYADGNIIMNKVWVRNPKVLSAIIKELKKQKAVIPVQPVQNKNAPTPTPTAKPKTKTIVIDEDFDGETLIVKTEEGITERLGKPFYTIIESKQQEPVQPRIQADAVVKLLKRASPEAREQIVAQILATIC